MVAVPYPIDTNDIVAYTVEKQPAEEFYVRCAAALETLFAESAGTARILGIALHPYLSGTPGRIAVVDRIIALARERYGACTLTAGEIHDWYVAQTPPPPTSP